MAVPRLVPADTLPSGLVKLNQVADAVDTNTSGISGAVAASAAATTAAAAATTAAANATTAVAGATAAANAATTAAATATATANAVIQPSAYTSTQLAQIYPTGTGAGNATALARDGGYRTYISPATGWPSTAITYPLGVGGLPFLLQGSCTVGNNGSITGLVVRTQSGGGTFYPGLIYTYWNTGALFAGQRPGWYVTQMLTATTATVYNNPYTGGQPLAPAVLNNITATGPGAYTQVTTAVSAPSWNMPRLMLGTTGSMEFKRDVTYIANTNAKQVQATFGSANSMGSGGDSNTNAGVTARQVFNVVRMAGQTGVQKSYNPLSSAVIDMAVDTTKDFTVGYSLQLGAATDWMCLESYEITVIPAGTIETPPPQIITPSSANIIPPGAVAAGLATNAYYLQPSANDVAGWAGGTFTSAAGSKFYAGFPLKTFPPYSVGNLANVSRFNRANVMAFTYDTVSTIQSISAVTPSYGVGVWPFLDASLPFYVECAFSLSGSHPDHWPAFWLEPIERTNSSTTTYTEIDIFEGGLVTRSNRTYMGGLTSAVVYRSTSAGVYPSANSTTYNNAQSGTDWGLELDLTLCHTFGVSWNPSTKILQYWQDGSPVWSQDCTAIISGGSPMNTHHYYPIISVQSINTSLKIPYTMYVEHISAWIT